ncbi:DUF4395 domain-containing protein [Angustibacter sp. Root456]|uniref:DUF4395 domain-containing protein n=1 Tax=Angustibacter sp. Root456 TaxID=1736539 RepID=UPI0006F775D1|nr:DUF4395 domain-containing protein [Angustibacter sp. Root456]KQX65780.1 hypothetical protein ASD06_09240 [Angustibacter sp. Root456]
MSAYRFARTVFPRTVDDVTVRLIAGEVLVLSVLALVTGQAWVLALLAADFTVRAAFGPVLSPLARLAAVVLRPRIPAAPRPTPGPPKRFAAAIGAVLTLGATAAFFAGWPTVTWVITGVMVAFPLLEAAFGVCVGCIAFSLLMRLGVIPRSVCEECADITLRLSAARRAQLADLPRVQVAKTLSR